MLPSDESRIIEEAKLAYSPIGKVFWKQTKTTEEQGKKTNWSNWRAWKTIS